MGKLIICEIRKLFQQKMVWGILVGLLFLNVILVYREMISPLDEWGEYTRIQVAEFYAEHEGMDTEELLKELEQSPWQDNGALTEYLYEQIREVDTYDAYLKGIAKEQERLSGSMIFSETDSFSSRNIHKIAVAYEKLEGRKLQAGQSYDIETVTDSSITTYLLLIAVILLGLRIVLAESESKVVDLIRPMKRGRIHTILAKEAAMAVVLCFTMLAFYLCNFCIGVSLFGFGGMDRLIQGMDGYLHSPYQITAGEYLAVFLLGKYVGFMAAAMLIFFLCMEIKNAALSGALSVAVFLSEKVICQRVDIHSFFSLVRQINFAAGLDTASFFQNYRTMNLFGYPVSAICCTLTAMIVFSILFGGLSCRKWCVSGSFHAFSLRDGKKGSRERAYADRMHTNLLLHECYKLLIMNKGAWILIGLCAVQFFSYKDFSIHSSEIDYYYEQYSEILEGKIYWRKEMYLINEGEAWKEQAAQAENYAQQAEKGEVSESYAAYMMEQALVADVKKQAFDMSCEQYRYLLGQQKLGKNVCWISLTGYRALLDDERSDVSDAVKMTFVIIFGLCTMISCERATGMEVVIRSSRNGKRRVLERKWIVSLCYVVCAWALAFLPRMILVSVTCGMPHLAWSSASLEWFSNMPGWIPVWGAIFILQLIRIGGGLIAALVVLWLSGRTEHVAVTIVLSVVILLLPALLYYLGLTGEWGLLPVTSGKLLLGR